MEGHPNPNTTSSSNCHGICEWQRQQLDDVVPGTDGRVESQVETNQNSSSSHHQK
jgi:hypothetical protein